MKTYIVDIDGTICTQNHFKEGKRDGYGRLYFPEGDQFDCIIKDGPWKNDGWGGPIA